VREFAGERKHRKTGPITFRADGWEPVEGLAVSIVSNTSPWTYLGNRPVYASPEAGFDTNLDLFGMTRMSLLQTLRTIPQLLDSTGVGPHGKHVVAYHDLPEFTLHSQEPMPFQVDGDHLGERKTISFTGVSRALRVIV
jgi:diacylglycerol kinase family enzyme